MPRATWPGPEPDWWRMRAICLRVPLTSRPPQTWLVAPHSLQPSGLSHLGQLRSLFSVPSSLAPLEALVLAVVLRLAVLEGFSRVLAPLELQEQPALLALLALLEPLEL